VERAGQLYYLAMGRRANWPAPARGLAATQLVSGQSERAAESFARALRLRPNSATLNYEYAVALAAAGQPARAAEHFRRARELAPAQPAVWIGLSRVLRQMGEWGEAERVLSEARRRWPNEALVERELALYPGGGSAPTVVPGAPAVPASAPRSRSTYQE
jgi:predicted Zn-dependent protease